MPEGVVAGGRGGNGEKSQGTSEGVGLEGVLGVEGVGLQLWRVAAEGRRLHLEGLL